MGRELELDIELSAVDGLSLGRPDVQGARPCTEISLTLAFKSAKGETEVVKLTSLSGTYRKGAVGFLFDGPSRERLQKIVYSQDIDRLWVGNFWARAATLITIKIEGWLIPLLT
jgi:hypothetical protein